MFAFCGQKNCLFCALDFKESSFDRITQNKSFWAACSDFSLKKALLPVCWSVTSFRTETCRP